VGGDSISAEYHLGLLLLLIDLGGFVAPAIQLAQKCSTDWPILYWGSGLVDMPELEEPRCSVMATRSSTFMRLPSFLPHETLFELAQPLRHLSILAANHLVVLGLRRVAVERLFRHDGGALRDTMLGARLVGHTSLHTCSHMSMGKCHHT
jgi:hypothetical protein